MEYHDSLSEMFCLTVPKKNRTGIFQCFACSGIGNFYALEG